MNMPPVTTKLLEKWTHKQMNTRFQLSVHYMSLCDDRGRIPQSPFAEKENFCHVFLLICTDTSHTHRCVLFYHIEAVCWLTLEYIVLVQANSSAERTSSEVS